MTAHVRRRRAATTVPSLRSIVAAAGAVLTPLDPGGPRAVPDIAVRGIEVYQPGVPTDYSGHLVVVGHPVRDRPSLIEVSESCAGAAALILPSTTPAGLGGPPAPFRLRRARWIGGDALLRALAALTHLSEAAGAPTDGPGAAAREAAFAERCRTAALLTVLGGDGDTATAAVLAGLRPDRGHAVVAAAVTGDDHARVRLALSAEFPHQRQVTTGGLLLAVLPVDPDGTDPDGAGADDDDDDDRSVAHRLRARLGAALDASPTAAVGVGPLVTDLARLPESGRAARDVLRALRLPLGKPPSLTGLRIAEPQDVEDALQVVRASTLLRPHGGELAARLRLLADHDRAHRTELLPTVLTVATTASNVAEAARRLGVHPNSLRARLARIETVAGIDLGEPVSALRTVLGLLADPDLHRPARRD